MSHIVTAKSLPAKCLNQISQATLELLVVRLENENDAYLLGRFLLRWMYVARHSSPFQRSHNSPIFFGRQNTVVKPHFGLPFLLFPCRYLHKKPWCKKNLFKLTLCGRKTFVIIGFRHHRQLKGRLMATDKLVKMHNSRVVK